MPNWTINKLTIQGAPAKLKEFRESARGTDEEGVERDLLFSALIPEPDETPVGHPPLDSPQNAAAVSEDDEDQWRVVRWGTKWEAEKVTIEEGTETLKYEFLSAWNAPFPWLVTVSGIFPDLRFTLDYQDEGSDEDYGDILLRCVFVEGEILEADAQAIGHILAALMAGTPPDDIREWVENVQKGILKNLRTAGPEEKDRSTDLDPETS